MHPAAASSSAHLVNSSFNESDLQDLKKPIFYQVLQAEFQKEYYLRGQGLQKLILLRFLEKRVSSGLDEGVVLTRLTLQNLFGILGEADGSVFLKTNDMVHQVLSSFGLGRYKNVLERLDALICVGDIFSALRTLIESDVAFHKLILPIVYEVMHDFMTSKSNFSAFLHLQHVDAGGDDETSGMFYCWLSKLAETRDQEGIDSKLFAESFQFLNYTVELCNQEADCRVLVGDFCLSSNQPWFKSLVQAVPEIFGSMFLSVLGQKELSVLDQTRFNEMVMKPLCREGILLSKHLKEPSKDQTSAVALLHGAGRFSPPLVSSRDPIRPAASASGLSL